MNNRESSVYLGEMQRLLEEMKKRQTFFSEKMMGAMKQLERSCQALSEVSADADAKKLLEDIKQTVSEMQIQFGKLGVTFQDKNLLNEFNMQASLYKQKIQPAVTLVTSTSSSKSLYQRLQQNSQVESDVVTRPRADRAPPPPAIQPSAPPKSNAIPASTNIKRNRELPPLPTASSASPSTRSPDHKVVRRETVGKAVELADLANELDKSAKSVTSQFDHAGRSSMANILRKGDHVKDADVMLFVKYYQDETSVIKNMVKNALPPEMAAVLVKKPNDLVRSDKELFKAIMCVNPQEAPKPGSSK